MIAEGKFIAGPAAGNTRVHEKRLAAQAETQQPLHSRSVHPARRTGIPSPAAAPRVRRFGVDVTGRDIGLHLIALDVRSAAPVVDGVEHPEELPGLVAIAERGEG